MAHAGNDLILQVKVKITDEMMQRQRALLEAQADSEIAQRGQWNEERITQAILSDFKDLLSLKEEDFQTKKDSDLIYKMLKEQIDSLRTSRDMEVYFREKSDIEATAKQLDKEHLNPNRSNYINRLQSINERKKENSKKLETVCDSCKERILKAITPAGKAQFTAKRISSEKENAITGLVDQGFNCQNIFSLRVSTIAPAETAKIWNKLTEPLVSDTTIDLQGAIFHAAISLNAPRNNPPATKGFIHDRKYWLGVQPLMTLTPLVLSNINTKIQNGKLASNEGILNGHMKELSTQLLNSLRVAKVSFDQNQIDSALFLSLSIQSDANGLKSAAHYECFQITRDPANDTQFIIHEANSSRVPTQSLPPDRISEIASHDSLQYVLTQAREAGYDISTLKTKTVYHQATNEGCGFCALQTAIDSAMSGQSISELPLHECATRSTTIQSTVETELRVGQMAILFNSPDHGVQGKLAIGAASQYIYLQGPKDYQRPPPNGELVQQYLPPFKHALADPRGVTRFRVHSADDGPSKRHLGAGAGSGIGNVKKGGIDLSIQYQKFNEICKKLQKVSSLANLVANYSNINRLFFNNITPDNSQRLFTNFQNNTNEFIRAIEQQKSTLPASTWNDIVVPGVMALIGCIGMIGRAIYGLVGTNSPYEDYKATFFQSERTRLTEAFQYAQKELNADGTDPETLMKQLNTILKPTK